MSVVNIGKESIEGFNAGNGTVGTTPQALGAACPVNKHVIVRADAANANVIKLAPTKGATAAGFILKAGETSPPIYVDDVAKVFVVGGAAGQNYSWISN